MIIITEKIVNLSYICKVKYIIAIFIASTVLFASLQKSLVFAFYELEKDYVIEQLCINKDVPGSCCKGKCFIEKQTSEKEAEGIIINVLKNIKEEFYFEHSNISALSNLVITVNYTANKTLNLSTFHDNIFHPPCIA